MSSANFVISPEQIIAHREQRKALGLVGCKDGSDWPLDSLRGISWRPEDPMNPHCFCHDCRTSWDPDGVIDATLVKNSNEDAIWTYRSLLPKDLASPTPPPARPLLARPINLLPRTNGGGWREPEEVKPAAATPPTTPLSVPRVQILPRTGNDFSISLPAPRHRDVMNESRETRIKKDLLELLTDFRSEMIDIMDSRRTAIYKEDDGSRCKFLEEVDKKETAMWEKIHAAELLIHVLDA